ncbi:DUF3105 domain-containing protein [Glaciihabitans arcticus]|uniref:DUF3105 domain-containing protein n=1 Tax=Glaciihabitans arcticus TaxID=2668039 RepID=UPI001EFF919B|nr:DUF3105 domain-containing protein [Glaciihabitans arcticus]
MPTNSDLTVKQQRDARRAEKVAVLKKKQASERRNRIIGWSVGGVLGAGAIAAIVILIISTSTPRVDPGSIEIEGLKTFDLEQGVHVDLTAEGTISATPPTVDYQTEYGMNPPAGGNHWAAWLNCGAYTEPQQNERAVHALEHGAVWVTYNPDELDATRIAELRGEMPDTYIVFSPYPDLPAPIVLSAWGAQVQVDTPDDERIEQFLSKYWKSADAPEPGAACTGGIDGPGLDS